MDPDEERATMKRRDFLKRTALGAATGGALAGCAPTETRTAATGERPQVAWRLASSYPPSLDTIFGAATVLADRVAELTGGRFSIRVAAPGEIVPGLQVMDAVQQGSVQAGHTAGYYFIGKHPALVFDTSVPFGLTARQQLAWLYEGGGLELLREVYADFNIISFPGGTTGAQMGGWFRDVIESVDDLKGLKMRIPGMGGKVMDRLGVSVQVLAGGEIYQALERSTIDAAEWVGPYDDENLGFHKIAKNYYYPGWWEPGATLTFQVNRDAWDKLPGEYQAAFETATIESSLRMMAQYDALNPAALTRLLQQGVVLRRFSDDIMDAANRENTDLMETLASEDAAFRKIHDAWTSFRDESVRWFGTAEVAIINYASGKG